MMEEAVEERSEILLAGQVGWLNVISAYCRWVWKRLWGKRFLQDMSHILCSMKGRLSFLKEYKKECRIDFFTQTRGFGQDGVLS